MKWETDASAKLPLNSDDSNFLLWYRRLLLFWKMIVRFLQIRLPSPQSSITEFSNYSENIVLL